MLRDDVYDYLWKQIKEKRYQPGEFIDLNQVARTLEVSRTPLREALVVLESEGFVDILPKRGIRIRQLTLQDMHDLYEIIGSLESAVIMSVWPLVTAEFIAGLEQINDKLADCRDYAHHYVLNHSFHFAYIRLSENMELRRYLARLYQRIYDFSGMNYGERFQNNNCAGHAAFIALLKSGDRIASADFLRDTHWKFRVPEVFV